MALHSEQILAQKRSYVRLVGFCVLLCCFAAGVLFSIQFFWPPPTEPVHAGSRAVWDRVRREIGYDLPPDYYDYVVTYGDGTFC